MKYSVSYKYVTYSDAVIDAKSKKEAIRRVQEVLPEVEIESVQEHD